MVLMGPSIVATTAGKLRRMGPRPRPALALQIHGHNLVSRPSWSNGHPVAQAPFKFGF